MTYLVSRVGDPLSAQLATQMTFPLLEAQGIHIDKIDAIIECTHADYQTSNYLDVPLGHPLIVYRYTAFSSQYPVLHGETISRADRFCYSLVVQADTV
ncbi:MAG: UTRA domain-containing protein [Cyanobacteria bacterium J06629_9]